LQKEPHWQIGYLPGVAILHTGYQRAMINQQNKSARAAAAMSEFLTAHPHDPYVCSKLGALYVEMGQIDQGMELLTRGLNEIIGTQGHDLPADMIPGEPNYDILYELHYHLGITYTHLKNLPEAMAHYQAAARLPIYPLLKLGAYNNLGSLLKASGDLQGARVAYETTIKIDPRFVTGYYNLGMVLKAAGLFVEAIAAYDQAIHLNPDYAEAYQNLAVVLLKIGDVQASLTAFDQAIALHELDNPEEAQRLRQGLEEMGLMGRS
jgi:tetratricopeptide (TPR) repeat protein